MGHGSVLVSLFFKLYEQRGKGCTVFHSGSTVDQYLETRTIELSPTQ